ncbi:MAG: hypothetical protein JSU77_11585 [Fidelibacterota bacterium]|nr:MAG: hypothetical protein JSU77_11585 [Candidatus Neomarinimicrobiota bacterium]
MPLIFILVLGRMPCLHARDTGGSAEKGALIRSLIMPGWGQYALGDHKVARRMVLIETGLWLSYALTRGATGWYQQDYRAFAALHADVAYPLKSDAYYYRLGRYDSITEYNQVQLRQRNISDVYRLGEGYDWQWDDAVSRERYKNLHRASLIAAKGASFILGGMIVNRAVAVIHVLFLSRMGTAATASWTPLPGGGRLRIHLLL